MQKQEATILSAELSGFQSLAENLGSQEITSLIKEVHTLVENTTRLHQGEINRYTGDTFLVLFYSNKTNKTAAKNALDLAFELKDQLTSSIANKHPDQTFSLKIGIATGGILAADIGGEQQHQTLIGESVTFATRICQFAGDGQILVGDKTIKGLKDEYEFQKLEPIPLKGSDEALPIFELLGRKRKNPELKVSTGRAIASAMVGRGREFEQLDQLIQQLVTGKGSVVNIVGNAGIGKSRFMAEIKAQPLMAKVLILEGRALSAGKNLSYHPIIHLIKSWAGISEEDAPAVSSEKLLNGIKRRASAQADEIYSFLATMMGLPLTGKYQERVKGIEGEALEKLILEKPPRPDYQRRQRKTPHLPDRGHALVRQFFYPHA